MLRSIEGLAQREYKGHDSGVRSRYGEEERHEKPGSTTIGTTNSTCTYSAPFRADEGAATRQRVHTLGSLAMYNFFAE